MSKPKYVKFPVAKLLKEKGFDVEIDSLYSSYSDNLEVIDNSYLKENNVFVKNEYIESKNWNATKKYTSAPLQSEVVDWLLEKHGIWVFVGREPETGIFYPNIDVNKGDKYFDKFGNFKTPQKAYEAAFKYILTKLI